MHTPIKGSAWVIVATIGGGTLAYRHTHRSYGPKGERIYLYFCGHPTLGGTPPRWVRKAAKLTLGHEPRFRRASNCSVLYR